MYRAPAVNPPTTEQLQRVAENNGLHLEPSELQQYRAHMAKFLATYDRLEDLPQPCMHNDYPTTPGYIPAKEDNKYNAWARIINLHGAETGKLTGKTVAVKDNVAISGVPLVCGSKFMRGHVPDCHATVVTRILDAGGFIKGKTTCEDLCWDGNSFTSASGPVLNPHDVTRSTGGSSSGSGALLAAGEVDMAIGTDQGGSVRIPACWCGVVGLKPTHGLVPYTGVMGMDNVIDHVGPMARTVTDCALLLEVIAGPDGLDPRQQLSHTPPNYSGLLTGDLTGVKIGLLREGFEDCEDDVAQLVRTAAEKLKSVGATVEEMSFPLHKAGVAAWTVICVEGSYNTFLNAGMSVGTDGFKDVTCHDFMFNASKTRVDDVSVSYKTVILTGGFIKEQYGCHYYGKAVNAMRAVVQAYSEVFKKYDVLIMPTITHKPAKLPQKDLSVEEYMSEALRTVSNTATYDSTGHPALSINAGYSYQLPVGMMIVGRHFEDGLVLKVAHAHEQLRDAVA